MLFACSMTWSIVTVPMLDDAEGPVRTASMSGTDLAPIASASAWVALAGVLAVIATKSWGRTIVGAVVLTAGVVIVVSSALTGPKTPSSAWWLLAVAGGIVVAFGGVLVLVPVLLAWLSLTVPTSLVERLSAASSISVAMGG